MKRRNVLIGVSTIRTVDGFPISTARRRTLVGSGVRGDVGREVVVRTRRSATIRGLVALHGDGILAETSSGLHANSLGVNLPFNASDGYGTWVPRSDRRRSAYTFYKMLFGEDGLLAGYLRVTGSLEIDPENRNHIAGNCTVDFVFGPDPAGSCRPGARRLFHRRYTAASAQCSTVTEYCPRRCRHQLPPIRGSGAGISRAGQPISTAFAESAGPIPFPRRERLSIACAPPMRRA